MERFTRRMPGGYGLVEGRQLGTVTNNRAVINRLAAYENSGMEPEEVSALIQAIHSLGVSSDKLQELVKNSGAWKYIPVKALVGETVWVVEHYQIVTPYEIQHIDSFGGDNRTYYCVSPTGYHAFDEEEFGDTVFHSAEEALAAVENLEE